MTGAATLAGSIDVVLALQGGRVMRVDINSTRAFGISRLAIARSGDAVVALIGRLFSLCAQAQSLAAAAAIAAACDEQFDGLALRARTAAVLAERLIELLRGAVTALAGSSIGAFAPAMRRIAGAARKFDARSPQTASAAIDAVEQALGRLGLAPRHFADEQTFARWLADAPPFASLMRAVAESEDASFGAIEIDPLDPDADRVIGERLLANGIAFSAQPCLGQRVPETGALARNANHPLLAALMRRYGAGMLVRWVARLVEICAVPARLRAALVGENDGANADLVRCYAMGQRRGLAAVECARGRLHHLVEVAGDGRISRLEILSPTEWNFHPRGALARALGGAKIGADAAAWARVDRLVAAFDPCVAFRVHRAEVGDA